MIVKEIVSIRRQLATVALAIDFLQLYYCATPLGVTKPLVQAVAAHIELARRSAKAADIRDPSLVLLCRRLGALIQRHDLCFIRAHRRGIKSKELVDIAVNLEQAFQVAQHSQSGTSCARIIRRKGSKS